MKAMVTPEPLVQSIRELWEDERNRRLKLGLDPSPPPPSDDVEHREGGSGWRGKVRDFEDLQRRMEDERASWHERVAEPWEALTWSTFESVEMLWDPKYRTLRPPMASSEASQESPAEALGSQSTSQNPFESPPDFLESDGEEEQPVEQVDKEFLGTQSFQAELNKEQTFATNDELEQQTEQTPAEAIPLGEEFNEDGTPDTTPSKPITSSALWDSAPSTPIKAPDFSKEEVPSGGEVLQRHASSPTAAQNTFGGPPKVPTKVDTSKNQLSQSSMIRSGALLSERNYVPTKLEHSSSLGPLSQPSSSGPSLSQHISVGSGDRSIKRRRVGNLVSWSESPRGASSPSNSSFPPPSLAEDAFIYGVPAPTIEELLSTRGSFGLPSAIHGDPFYSSPADRPTRAMEVAGRSFLISGNGLTSLLGWEDDEIAPGSGLVDSVIGQHTSCVLEDLGAGNVGWEYAGQPPPPSEVRNWIRKYPKSVHTPLLPRVPNRSQIFRPTPITQAPQLKSHIPHGAKRQNQSMSVMALEIFACSSGNKLPDPVTDPILAVFYCYQSTIDPDDRRASYIRGIIAVRSATVTERRLGLFGIHIVDDELSLINALEDTVHELDPDVLTGWELQNSSWGYISERVRHEFSVSLSSMVSRVIESEGRGHGASSDWSKTHDTMFKTTGRHVLNIWSLFRSEQTFTSYTFENNVFQILQRRTPRYSSGTLGAWYHSDIPARTARVFEYFYERTAVVIDMIDEMDVITKNSEFARIFGVDFLSVLTRGSQFKVEAFMFRLAKPENFVLISPSREDVGRQNAAECIPMIMEPSSAFYKSPLLVLDFQSLYPSVMIAYNYCYSTCLGRIRLFKGKNQLGITELNLPEGLIEYLKDYIHIAANGLIYVKPSVRKSLLAKMLEELLDTRVMVKQAMKRAKGDKALSCILMKILDARQLSLKYIANVTYGYTSASFSGRMPCVEIADSIVESGRQTLEKAIDLIDGTPAWGGRVVYGDTDSLFVSLPGKTKAEAFRIGQDIVNKVTALNPCPIKLKFEKVYFPCVLMAKKRYVGFKYESPDDVEPVFDAKGIETVRRDGVPAQARMLETCLKILFRTQDLSQVKEYCIQMWTRLLAGKVSIQDFAFSKAVRLGTYSESAPPVPGAVVAALQVKKDSRNELYGDRVPYVITRGSPKTRLADRAHSLDEVIWHERDGKEPLYLDAVYYIERTMPKVVRAESAEGPVEIIRSPSKGAKFKIDSHFRKLSCVSCGKLSDADELCSSCRANKKEVLLSLTTRLRDAEYKLSSALTICGSCSGIPPIEGNQCESYDCPWFFERHRAEDDAEKMAGIWDAVMRLQLS
ncbi:uncharacterized protein EI90DRAFT_3279675 [Cantharellus anzutake]|uniref:uncharacterized protein n=1 Tax=Cantharellus anzutake TaxID=1750568 RepID=UPI00190381D0|nr:uncharacterized protein EI90DRAFT_3279675 [Cantharellus anzutake]KAF8337368.1 hypothetical protein EI90DRAFT_3279675 [Cantharellus anzutake]